MFRVRDEFPAVRSALAALILGGCIASYLVVQQLVVRFHHDIPEVPASAWDRTMPFFAWAVLPYALLGGLQVVAACGAGQQRFRRWVAATLIAQVVALATFVLWPMQMPRPVAEDAFGQGVLDLLQQVDQPVNTVPSLHVVAACLAAFAWPRWHLICASAIIALSVLPLHQHRILDVISGGTLAVAAWWLARATMPGGGQPAEDTDPTADRATARDEGASVQERDGPRPARVLQSGRRWRG